MTAYFSRGAIFADALFKVGTQTHKAPVILDTGAEGFMTLDTRYANKIGLPLRFAGMVTGVGGSVPAYRATLDKFSLEDILKCDKPNMGITVANLGRLYTDRGVALLGLDFMREVQMRIRLEGDTAYVRCRDGNEVPIKIRTHGYPRTDGGPGAKILDPSGTLLVLGGAAAVTLLAVFLIVAMGD